MDENSYATAGVILTSLDDQTIRELDAAGQVDKPFDNRINTIIAAVLVLLMIGMVIAIVALGVAERYREQYPIIATMTAQASASH